MDCVHYRGMAGPAEGQRVLRGDDLLYLWTLPPGHLLDAYSVKKILFDNNRTLADWLKNVFSRDAPKIWPEIHFSKRPDFRSNMLIGLYCINSGQKRSNYENTKQCALGYSCLLR